VYVDQNPAQSAIFFCRHAQDRIAGDSDAAPYFSEDTEVYGAYTRSRAHTNQGLNPVLGQSSLLATTRPARLVAPNRLLTWGWAPRTSGKFNSAISSSTAQVSLQHRESSSSS